MAETRETPEQIAARVRETLPDYLKRPQSEIDADKAAARLQAASFTRSRLTEAERLIAEGVKHERIARANLETQGALRDEGHTVSTHGGANLEMVEQELFRLSHGLELQGRYAEAAEAHPHKRERARLRKIEEAIARPDGEHCECPADTAQISGRTFEGHPHYEVKRVYSRSHGRVVSLMQCRKCGDLNATPTPPAHLTKTLAAVNASHGVAIAQSRERMRRG
jgi:hypothetical protein